MSECQGRIPGPGYGLGNLTGFERHDFTKNRAPAYSLGLHTKGNPPVKTPGPYNVGNVDRTGRPHNLGWTIESKTFYGPKPIDPSPLSYAPEKIKPYTPAYSLGLKLPPRPQPFGPSPAEYFPQFPPKPGCTIGVAFKELNKLVPPGPKAAVPTELYKSRAPAYSLGLKGKSLFTNNLGPGPKYYPGRLINAPAYSFGVKHHKCSPPLITYEDNN